MTTLTEFIKICHDGVRYAKQQSDKFHALQTFAVLDNLEDVHADNLGKNIVDRYRHLFYSKKFEGLKSKPSNLSFEYPAMFAVLNNYEKEGVFRQKRKDCFTLQLSFLYPHFENQSGKLKNIKNNLRPFDITNQMIALSEGFIDYLKGVVYADVDGVTGWYNKYVLEAQKAKGIVTNYELFDVTCNRFQKALKDNNDRMNFRFIDSYGKDCLYGVAFNIELCTTNCEVGEFEVDLKACCTGAN